MLQRMSGRGLHPLVTDDAVRFWSFDEPDATAVADLVGGLPLAFLGDRPIVFPSPVGANSRRLGSTGSLGILRSGTANADSPVAQGQWTLQLWVRLNALPASLPACLVALAGNQISSLEANNTQLELSLLPTGFFRISTESGAGVAASFEFDAHAYREGAWQHLAVRKAVSGGLATYDLFVGGVLVQTSTPLANPTGGTDVSVRWDVGARSSTVGIVNAAVVDVASIVFATGLLSATAIARDAARGHGLGVSTHVQARASIADQTGALRDLTQVAGRGVSMLDSASVKLSTDNAVNTASLSLKREHANLSLAYLRTDSLLNLSDPDTPTSWEPLLEYGRALEVWACRAPLGIAPSGVDWFSIFRGTVDTFSMASDPLSVDAVDGGGVLVETTIEEEVLNSSIIPGAPFEKRPSYGSPAGRLLELNIQDILDDNDNDAGNNTVPGLVPRLGSYDPLDLLVVGTPLWAQLPWRQRREPVMSAIRTVAGEIGWECRFVRVNGDTPEGDDHRLALFEPDRDRLDADLVVSPLELKSIRDITTDGKNIRTVVRVVYPSSETVQPAPSPPAGYIARSGWVGVDGRGQRMPAFVEYENVAARDRWGRKFFEFGEAVGSEIESMPVAERMVLSAIEDLSTPDADYVAQSCCLPELDIRDWVAVLPIKEAHTGQQRLASVDVTHDFGESASSSWTLRGKPAVGFKRWLRLEARPGQARPGVTNPLLALTDTEVGPTLRILRELMDRTDYMTGGKFLAIKNPDFQFWSGGVRNAPDGWSRPFGADWQAGLGTVGENSVVTRTGGHSIRLDNGGEIQSDYFPVESDSFQTPAYSFELQWQRSTAVATVPTLTLEWFDSSYVSLGVQVLQPGGLEGSAPIIPGANPPFENMSAVPTTANQWFNSRVDGIQPPIGARFCRASILNSGVATTLYVDKFSGYRSTRAALVYPSLSPFRSSGGAAWNIPLNRLTPGLLGSTLRGYDRGISMVDDLPSGNGRYFLVKESGTYDLSARVWFVRDTFSGSISEQNVRVELVQNGTYTTTGINAGQRTGGSVLVRGRYSGPINPAPNRSVDIEFTVRAALNSRLSLDWVFESGNAGLTIAGGLTTEPTQFQIALRSTS